MRPSRAPSARLAPLPRHVGDEQVQAEGPGRGGRARRQGVEERHRVLGHVLPGPDLEADGGEVGAGLLGGGQGADRGVLGPRHRVGEGLSVAGEDVEEGQPAGGAHDPAHACVQPRLVGDVHGHVLGPHHVEGGVGVGEGEGVALLDGHPVGEAHPSGQVHRHLAQLVGQVDAGDPDPVPAGQQAGGASEAAADVQHRLALGQPGGVGQGDGGQPTEGVELLHRGERVGVEVIGVVAGLDQGRQHTLVEGAAGVVGGDVIGGHRRGPLALRSGRPDPRTGRACGQSGQSVPGTLCPPRRSEGQAAASVLGCGRARPAWLRGRGWAVPRCGGGDR